MRSPAFRASLCLAGVLGVLLLLQVLQSDDDGTSVGATAVDDPTGGAVSTSGSPPAHATKGVAPAAPSSEVAMLRRALAREKARVATLERQLRDAELGNDRRLAAVRARLREPRIWLERLMPDQFRGLTTAQLQHMRELDLSSSKLAVQDLGHLQYLPDLRRLTLRRTSVDDTGLTYLTRVPSLMRLGLRETKVTDAGMPTIAAMSKLEYLDLNMLPITDAGLADLRSLAHLKFLRLNFTQVTDEGMQHVAQLRALERLDLWGTRVTDRGLPALWHLPRLRHLDIGATVVSEDWVQRFVSEHPNCTVQGVVSPYGR